ncbi:MAG: ParA family protein [Synergistaceae bacterium]|nr:ParA family protein [Synergistaceae bacterium]MBQ6738694.1 ParA family protein [Synergistaceae bacterium]MBQ7069116.1 ParA family protein [Synergistaceae bacterium]MBR0075786.1 ParA family protein [Synergistaceae bacterium]
MSKIAVAVLNRKGGVGKTTVSVIISQIALIRHNKVLAIDLDPSRNFSDALGFMKNYFKDSLRIKDTLEDDDAGAEEEWIVIDCPPNLDEASKHAIDFADIVLVPVRPDFFSLSNLGVMYSTAKKSGKEKAQLPLVKLGYDTSAMSKIANQIIAEREYPVAEDLPLHKHIPYNITSGRVWSSGLIARSRQPYEKLYDKILKAIDKLKDGISDINEVWTDRKDGKEDDAENENL